MHTAVLPLASGGSDGSNSPMLMVEGNAGHGNGQISPGLVGETSRARPRRGVADTSSEAFHSLPVADYLQPKERAVMALFTGPEVVFTREQIAHRLRWKEAAVCGRANSLVTKGQLEEIEGGKTASGRSAKLLRLPRAGAQGSLL